ncbi:MAG TPA: acyl-CoA dehydrogenase family protein [Gaiellaceae bacterium]
MRLEQEERRLLLETVDRLVAHVVEPRAQAIDESAEFPRDVYSAMAEADLFRLWVPEEYGGIETDLLTVLLVTERIARVSGACSLIFSNCGDGTRPIVLGGSDEVKEAHLPGIAAGHVIPAYALTEPDAGSDAAAIASRARRHDDGWRISGRKQFITNGSVADVAAVFAVTDPAAGRRGISAFLVARDAVGFTVGHDEELLGLRGAPATELALDDTPGTLLGEEGAGFELALEPLDHARLTASAMALGVARGALERAVQYAKERVQFGRPIVEHQGLEFLLAERATDLAAAWALVEKAAALVERGRSYDASTYAAMAKLTATDAAMQIALDAVQVFGGYGLTRDFQVERMLRDVKAFQIFDGTNQIQKLMIGRHLRKSGLLVDVDGMR